MSLSAHNCSTCNRRYAILWRRKWTCGICIAETKQAEEKAKAEKEAKRKRREAVERAEADPRSRKSVYHCQLGDTN